MRSDIPPPSFYNIGKTFSQPGDEAEERQEMGNGGAKFVEIEGIKWKTSKHFYVN